MAYLQILQHGLVMLRNALDGGESGIARIEADHLHNIPTLLNETNENRHLYYIQEERGLYLARLRVFGTTAFLTEYLESMATFYSEPWLALAAIAGVRISD